MLATSEQDFLNLHFKWALTPPASIFFSNMLLVVGLLSITVLVPTHTRNRYNLIPIDYIMKHRRMVKERKLWVSIFWRLSTGIKMWCHGIDCWHSFPPGWKQSPWISHEWKSETMGRAHHYFLSRVPAFVSMISISLKFASIIIWNHISPRSHFFCLRSHSGKRRAHIQRCQSSKNMMMMLKCNLSSIYFIVVKSLIGNFRPMLKMQDHQKLVKSYEDFFVEWWRYYYEMVGIPIPADRSAYR